MAQGDEGRRTDAAITSDYFLYGANALFKYRFTSALHGLVRLGGGLSQSYHRFDYDGFAGPSILSYDPFARFGLALQFFTPFKMSARSGPTLRHLLGHNSLGIEPAELLGYKLY